MDKIAELFYQAYCIMPNKDKIIPENYEQTFHEFMSSLDKKQKEKYTAFDLENLELTIKREKKVIQFMLELLFPKD